MNPAQLKEGLSPDPALAIATSDGPLASTDYGWRAHNQIELLENGEA